MKFVKIKVYCIANTTLRSKTIEKWLRDLGATGDNIQDLFWANYAKFDEKGTLLITLAAKRCYNSFAPGLNPNVTKVRTDLAEFIDHILDSGHGSVLEHVTYTYAIEGVTRVLTGELNRHRAGVAISEGSMRYIRFSEMECWLPTCLQDQELHLGKHIHPDHLEDLLKYHDARCVLDDALQDVKDVEDKKLLSRTIFIRAFRQMESNYRMLQSIWADELAPDSTFADKKRITSMMRRIIGMGISTGGIWTFNLRALRHIITMRCSPAAEEEIANLAYTLLQDISSKEPKIFADFEKTSDGFFTPRYKKV